MALNKMFSENGLIKSIGEDEDVPIEEESNSEDENMSRKKKSKKKSNEIFSKNFHFNISDNENEEVEVNNDNKKIINSLDLKIQAKRKKLKKNKKKQNEKIEIDEEKEEEDKEEDETEDEEEEERQNVKDLIKIKEKKNKKKKKSDNNEEQEESTIRYGDEVKKISELDNFSEMSLSPPISKALRHLNWNKPTPIQASTIPIALMGKDVCACAATGTGKTGAFMIPILERLIHKPNSNPVTRVLVLTPTRELALQIYQVSKELALYTRITFSLTAGGLDRISQEASLRLGPDVVIATLGRLIDHLQNAPNFNLESVEILVLDEADRMLDEYFAEQMKEVIMRCSNQRQTMLFSATMTEKVKDLALLSLKNPTKIFVDQNKQVALNLQQEFIRIRPNMDPYREAIVAALIKRTFQTQCIVFIETKKIAHRLHILLGLLGVKVTELHGNLTQLQRIEALENFKNAEVDVLIATDLVARGLDIDGIQTVINMNMPPSLERYIHRVGRTARAGKSGRSITLVGEKERNILIQINKSSLVPLKMRTLPQEVIAKYKGKIKLLENEIKEIENEEEEEKELRIAELKAHKATKMIKHEKEIMSKRKRTWFQSHKQRTQEKENLKEKTKKIKEKCNLK